jgi:hypothetical protein
VARGGVAVLPGCVEGGADGRGAVELGVGVTGVGTVGVGAVAVGAAGAAGAGPEELWVVVETFAGSTVLPVATPPELPVGATVAGFALGAVVGGAAEVLGVGLGFDAGRLTLLGVPLVSGARPSV